MSAPATDDPSAPAGTAGEWLAVRCVCSLIRDSDLPAGTYPDTFCDRGAERQGTLG